MKHKFYILILIIMKKFMFLTLWVFFIVGTLAWCWGNREIDNDNQWDFIIEDITWTYDAVIDYNDSLVDIAYQCIMSENNIPTDYEENGLDDVLAAINNTLTECQNSINQINSLWDWEGDGSLKDWIIRILELDVAYFTKFSQRKSPLILLYNKR